jgi:hypothetical protein
MDIEIAATPKTIESPDASEFAICIPLTAPPDELLLDALRKSPQISSFCQRLEAEDEALVVAAKDDGFEGIGTVLTAIQALIASTNTERAVQSMSDEEREAEARETKRRELDADIQMWWEQRA